MPDALRQFWTRTFLNHVYIVSVSMLFLQRPRKYKPITQMWFHNGPSFATLAQQ